MEADLHPSSAQCSHIITADVLGDPITQGGEDTQADSDSARSLVKMSDPARRSSHVTGWALGSPTPDPSKAVPLGRAAGTEAQDRWKGRWGSHL